MKRRSWHVPLLLLVAFALRLIVWRMLPYRDWISDEGEYWAAATWLARGRGFSFFDGWIWTRPPLYVLFLAAHIRVFGPTALWAPRLTQALLSVLTVWLTMQVAARLAPVGQQRRVALISGWAMALAYSFASFAFFMLSETLFLTVFMAAVWLILRWADPETRRWRWLVGAALLLGLAALTRAIILTWLPLVALWVAWQLRPQPLTRAWAAWLPAGRALAVLTLTVCVLVLPWSAYATRRWGGGDGLILVDTTGGYNLALGAQSALPTGRDENKLHDTLCGGRVCAAQAGSQAARQSAAYALGRSWISANPAGFVRKSGRELLDMLQLRYGGAERLRTGHTLGMVPAPHLLGLLSDDTLYALAVGLAALGLLRQQQRRGKGLVLGWLLYNVLVGALVFAINRFRQPLLPFLFIYAACALVQWRRPWPSVQRRWLAWGAAALLWLLVLPSYAYWPKWIDPDRRSVIEETRLGLVGLRYAAECDQIEALINAGQFDAARQRHDAATAHQKLPCLALLNARILEHEGRIAQAQALLRDADPTNALLASYVYFVEGDLYRRLGDLAKTRELFEARDVEITNATAWAWQHLDPPPTMRIDLGSGLDYGYIRGFYSREASDPNYRWSGPVAALRFPAAGTGQPQTLLLHASGYTTNANPTTVTPFVAGTALESFTLSADWQELRVALPATPAGADVVVEFHSPVFVPGPQDLEQRVRDQVAQPLRLLGFQLDWAELQ